MVIGFPFLALKSADTCTRVASYLCEAILQVQLHDDCTVSIDVGFIVCVVLTFVYIPNKSVLEISS